MGQNSDLQSLHKTLGDVANYATQYVTAGTVGYNGDSGTAKMGVSTNAVSEGLGEVTGRNLQREMMQQQNEALTKAETQRQIDKKALDDQNQIKDTQSSLAAKSNSQGSIMSLLQSGKVGLADAQKSQKLGSSSDFLGI